MKTADWLKNKISSFNIFEIGNSFALYYLFLFLSAPITMIIGDLIRWPGIASGEYNINYLAFFYLICGFAFFIIGYYCCQTFSVAGRISKFLRLKSEWDFKKRHGFCRRIYFWLGNKNFKIFGGAYAYWQQNSWLEKVLFQLIGDFDWFSYVALIIAFTSYFYFKK